MRRHARWWPATVRALVVVALAALSVPATGGPAAAEGSRADVKRYLADVADAAATPGVYVDPVVLDEGKLTEAQVASLTRRAGKVAGPVRVMVLPVAKLTVDRGGQTSADLAFRPERLVKEIYRRVDRPGTYAVLVSAPSQAEGQSFYAYQWPRGGPAYDIEDAATRAIACCAPDYAPMLRRFLKEADDPLKRGGAGSSSGGGPLVSGTPAAPADDEAGGPGPGTLAVVGLIVLGLGAGALVVWRRLRGTGTGGLEPDTAAALVTAFAEEVEELRQRAGSMGPAMTGDSSGAEARVAALRQLIDQAADRLATMRSAADAQAVARTLADARFELAAATALAENRAVPTRTPPCFVDPRHGLSAAAMVYPGSGLTSPVPVCEACRQELEAGHEPRPRLLSFRGSWTSHWLADAPAWVYLHGYWAGQPFMHDHFSLPPVGWASPDATAAATSVAPGVPPPLTPG